METTQSRTPDAPFPQETNGEPPPSAKRLFRLGFAIALMVGLATVFWLVWSIQLREKAFEASLEKRLELLAASRAEVMSVWLAGLAEQGERVIQSDLFRLYAAEVDLVAKDISLLVAPPDILLRQDEGKISQLAAQLPMMQRLLVDFTNYSGFLSGRIVNRNGQSFIGTDAATVALTTRQLQSIAEAFKAETVRFGPFRAAPQGLVLDIALPIFPPDAMQKSDSPVAVLLLSRVVTEKLNELLAAPPLSEEGEAIRLLQESEGGFQEIDPGSLAGRSLLLPFPELDERGMAFGRRLSLSGDETVYSVATSDTGLPFRVVVEANYATARHELRSYIRSAIGVGILIVLVFLVSFGALWSRLVGREDRRIAEHFERLALQIESQRNLLQGVNNSIPQFVALKGLDGRYRYVNPSFAAAVDRSIEEMTGLDDSAIFGFDTAKRLEELDRLVLDEGKGVNSDEQIYIKSQKRHFLISKVPFKDRDGAIGGTLSVFRDVTESVEARQRQERTIQQTVGALVKAIELSDPHLAGHTRLLGRVASEVAHALHIGEVDAATVETAANLSQIGKVCIDRDLLTKEEPLSPDEKKALEHHVEHAATLLEGIDFDLPVREVVCQMNELLDGSGYPKGFKGEQIVLPARILSVANSFCAMIEPRSYRSAKSVEEALQELEGSPQRYDSTVVAALKNVMESSRGERVLKMS